VIRLIVCLILFASQAAIADTYDGTTNRLTIPFLQHGDRTFGNAVVTVGSVKA
jgi:hypothetical protein